MIYLDHHASAPIVPAAREAIERALADGLDGNASSVHGRGRSVRARVESARAAIARVTGALPRELVFTSGGTEAVHLAVRGVGGANACAAVFVDPGAHPALEAACEAFARARGVPFEWIACASGGALDLADLARRASALRPALVAVSWVQHETGAVASMRALAACAREAGALLVVDAVQALGKLAIDAPTIGAAALAFSGHKIGAPPGIGAAWIAGDARATAVQAGGAQERGLRAGTENVLGALAFGAAANEVEARVASMARVGVLRARIEAAMEAIEGIVVNGREGERVATVAHASVRGVAGEELVAALDLEGIAVSSGPACSSGRPGPSATVRRLYPAEAWRASGALRVSLGPATSEAEVARFIDVLPRIVARVRGE